MFAIVLFLIIGYGFTHFDSYDMYVHTKIFRNKLFSYSYFE